jgi:iron complex transport system permease protein
MAGARFFSPGTIFAALTDYNARDYTHVVIVKQRLTRLAVAIYSGAVLAVAGVLLQKIMRNDLVSPSTLGINSGAVFCVVLAIYAGGFSGAELFWPALAGGISAIVLTFVASGIVGRGSPDSLSLVLGGAMTATLFSSATTFIVSLDPDAFGNVLSWLVGDIGNFDYLPLLRLWPVGFGCIACAMALSRSIDLLMLGTDQAASLGTDPRFVTFATLVLAILMSISAVCIIGPIGFIGLVVPHMTRLLLGEGGRRTMLFSAILGASILTLADILARSLFAPRLLTVGTVMALSGGTAFFIIISMVLRRRQAV